MKLIIDRFEGKYAVCETEDHRIINIKRNLIPSSSKEGDVLEMEGNTISANKEDTKNKKNKIDNLMEEVWE